MPIFRVESVKVYTGKKKFTLTPSVASVTIIRYAPPPSFGQNPKEKLLFFVKPSLRKGVTIQLSPLKSPTPVTHPQVEEGSVNSSLGGATFIFESIFQKELTLFYSDVINSKKSNQIDQLFSPISC